MQTSVAKREPAVVRHTLTTRVTHWLTLLAFLALLLTGIEIVLSHPRFYWGETGNVNMQPLFSLHLPSSRDTVPTGYGLLPDQNGWSRYLHFQAAWLAVLTGLFYGIGSIFSGHFKRDLLPASRNSTYSPYQRTVYFAVIFLLFPAIIWTGLALSPAFVSAFPFAVDLLGGRQSARTLHFFLSGSLVLFVFVHVVMVIRAGFVTRVRAMITGRIAKEQA